MPLGAQKRKHTKKDEPYWRNERGFDRPSANQRVERSSETVDSEHSETTKPSTNSEEPLTSKTSEDSEKSEETSESSEYPNIAYGSPIHILPSDNSRNTHWIPLCILADTATAIASQDPYQILICTLRALVAELVPEILEVRRQRQSKIQKNSWDDFVSLSSPGDEHARNHVSLDTSKLGIQAIQNKHRRALEEQYSSTTDRAISDDASIFRRC